MLYENKIKFLAIFLVLMKRQLIADQFWTHRWWKRNSKQLLRLKICLIVFLILVVSFHVTHTRFCWKMPEVLEFLICAGNVSIPCERQPHRCCTLADFFSRLLSSWTATNLIANNEWLRVISLLHLENHFAFCWCRDQWMSKLTMCEWKLSGFRWQLHLSLSGWIQRKELWDR